MSPADPLHTQVHTAWDDPAKAFSAVHALQDAFVDNADVFFPGSDDASPQPPPRDAFYILLPLLIVLSTFLFLLLLFLICVIILRRRRGIMLRDSDGPIDMSRDDLVEGEGGFEGVEARWLETANENDQRLYERAKQYQLQYPPNSTPTDITLSQFLSIQEKGVSAWCFEADFEALASLLVHARTEITFLPDPSSTTSIQSNLPLPKLNEVYYWEVKMFDLPTTTNVAIGLATKPYPSFRLPGLSRFSVGYHSSGDKSHNYPFTARQCGSALKEGDVLGVGYRPRTGTVFFTKNGRKMEDAYTAFNNYNLFPTVGADGPCSVHINFGQSGFVFIEANVKKWGLAPSSGTLAPPPPYGSERGSILLAAGGELPQSPSAVGSPAGASSRSRRSHRSRRARSALSSASPLAVSPLATSSVSSAEVPDTPPPPITPIEEESDNAVRTASGPSNPRRYISPTDMPFHTAPNANIPVSPTPGTEPVNNPSSRSSSSGDSSRSRSPTSRAPGSELAIHVHPPPESPSIAPGAMPAGGRTLDIPDHEPPAYSPLDAYTYRDGVQLDLPADVIAAALERGTLPPNVPTLSSRSDRRSRRERRS